MVSARANTRDGYYRRRRLLRLPVFRISRPHSCRVVMSLLRTYRWEIIVALLALSVHTIVFLAVLIPVLGLHIARRITNSLRIGIAAGIILALDPTLALLSFQFYTDTLFLVFFFAWTLLIFRYLERRDWTLLVTSAVLLGLAIKED